MKPPSTILARHHIHPIYLTPIGSWPVLTWLESDLVPGLRGGGPQVPRPVTRKILRKGSYVVRSLKGMVGSSQKIYNQVRAVCGVGWDGVYDVAEG